jgi:hypothetical protein
MAYIDHLLSMTKQASNYIIFFVMYLSILKKNVMYIKNHSEWIVRPWVKPLWLQW